jgi:hypothetical protein
VAVVVATVTERLATAAQAEQVAAVTVTNGIQVVRLPAQLTPAVVVVVIHKAELLEMVEVESLYSDIRIQKQLPSELV